MSDHYAGKDFVPRLPLERCRPLEEHLGIHIGPSEAALARAGRPTTLNERLRGNLDAACAASRATRRNNLVGR